MPDSRKMSIGEVARCTGLTERTLRYYEQQGLLDPPRSASGRREYGTDALMTLHHVTVLKRAGFSLSRIKQLVSAPSLAGEEIMRAQIAALEVERSLVDRALACLRRAVDAAAAGASLDLESLCDLILLGERRMKTEALMEYIDKNYTPEEQQRWKEAKLKAAGGDPEGYLERWNDLMQRIERALPLDPASAAAQGYLAEWDALLVPFVDALDDDLKAQAQIAVGTRPPAGIEPLVSERLQEFIEAARRVSIEEPE